MENVIGDEVVNNVAILKRTFQYLCEIKAVDADAEPSVGLFPVHV